MLTENKQKKGYWVAKANVISQEKQVSYGKLAEEVIKNFNGKFFFALVSVQKS